MSAWRELSVGLLSLTLLGEEYVAFRRGGALVATRCADGTEVFARYEGLACNTSAWRRLALTRTRTLSLALTLTNLRPSVSIILSWPSTVVMRPVGS